jgi:hypothetical protein
MYRHAVRAARWVVKEEDGLLAEDVRSIAATLYVTMEKGLFHTDPAICKEFVTDTGTVRKPGPYSQPDPDPEPEADDVIPMEVESDDHEAGDDGDYPG